MNREILDSSDYLQKSEKTAIGTQWDIASAYDVASRTFLYTLMSKMNFPISYIAKVKAMLENNNAVLFINNKEVGGIKLKRGLGQGDGISCLLFNLLMILPMMALEKMERPKFDLLFSKYRIKDIQPDAKTILSAPCISYADDMFLFLSSVTEVGNVISLLKKYELMSGLGVGPSKC